MPKLSKISAKRLSTCDPRLQAVVRAAIEKTDFSILCGYRNKQDQDDAFERGFSKVRWPYGRHNRNPSQAVDLAPYPIDWSDIGRFKAMMMIVKAEGERLGVPLRFGMDFNQNGIIGDDKFVDWPHVELDI